MLEAAGTVIVSQHRAKHVAQQRIIRRVPVQGGQSHHHLHCSLYGTVIVAFDGVQVIQRAVDAAFELGIGVGGLQRLIFRFAQVIRSHCLQHHGGGIDVCRVPGDAPAAVLSLRVHQRVQKACADRAPGAVVEIVLTVQGDQAEGGAVVALPGGPIFAAVLFTEKRRDQVIDLAPRIERSGVKSQAGQRKDHAGILRIFLGMEDAAAFVHDGKQVLQIPAVPGVVLHTAPGQGQHCPFAADAFAGRVCDGAVELLQRCLQDRLIFRPGSGLCRRPQSERQQQAKGKTNNAFSHDLTNQGCH